MQAKVAFERKSKEFSMLVDGYHADNGQFTEKEFCKEIMKNNQSISFCTIDAHH